MKFRHFALLALLAIFFVSLNAAEIHYKASKLFIKGWIKGKVTHTDSNLEVPSLEINRDTHACGSEARKIEAINIGPNGALRNAVVYIKEISAGKEFNLPATPPVLQQRGCQYHPHVQVIPPRSSLKITNEDNILHSVHAFYYEYGRKFVLYPNSITYPANTIFNIGMVATRKESYQQLNDPGIVKFICDAGHYWMTAYAVVMSHPYFVKVNDDGTYMLEDVPPGKYTLVSWHEYFGVLEKPVVVRENQPAEIDFAYSEAL